MTSIENKKIKCVYCGNNPTHHLSAYLHNNISVVMEPFDQKMFNGFFGRIAQWMIDVVQPLTFAMFEFFGWAKYTKNPEKFHTDRSLVIWEEAVKRGIDIEQMIFLDKPTDIFKVKINGRKLFFKSLPRPEHLETDSIVWLDDKMTLKKKLSAENIAVPRGGSFWNWRELKNEFEKLDKPVIIKPRLGSRGRHTTTFIYTLEDLKKAYKIAKELCHFVVMEEHIVGSVYRGTLVGGKLYGILRGDPPRITGDGEKNILQLIIEKNKNKVGGIGDVKIDDKMLEFLGRSNYDLNSVLEYGKTIDLTEKIGISYGGNAVEVFDETHSKIKSELVRAVNIVNDPIVGFDFIIEDITADPDTQKWGIIEANSLPFINLHHFPESGTPRDLAGPVWDLWEI